MKDASKLFVCCLGSFSIAMALCVASWITKSYFEAETYNRLTGAHTTAWDAMWVELRVQDSAK